MATHSLGTLIFWLVTAMVLFSAFAWLARSMAGMNRSGVSHFNNNVPGNESDSDLGPDPSLRQIAEDEVARYRFMNEERSVREMDEDMDHDEDQPFKKTG